MKYHKHCKREISILIVNCILAILIGGCSVVPRRAVLIQNPDLNKPRQQTATSKKTIRVALVKNEKRLSISASQVVRVYDMLTKKKIANMRLTSDTQIVIRDGRLLINGKFFDSQKIRFVTDKNIPIRVNHRQYRGQIEVSINQEQGGLLVVNYVPLEEYLYGVVPNEVLANWPEAVLQVQAVAARTFAFYKISGRAQESYDLDATVNSQVYGGFDSEKEATNQAARDTQGQVMQYHGKTIAAFYHSNCGGYTANVKDVWGSDMAYLAGTSCGFCDDAPHASWEFTIPHKELAARLRKRGANVGEIQNIELLGRDRSGRVLKVSIQHNRGKEEMKAPAFRLMIGADQLRSTKFNIQNDGHSFKFWGKGWGHGVGMCQEGALGMAKSGFNYRDILRHYYPGADIVKVRD